MYNRYIQGSDSGYAPIPEEVSGPRPGRPPSGGPSSGGPHPGRPSSGGPPPKESSPGSPPSGGPSPEGSSPSGSPSGNPPPGGPSQNVPPPGGPPPYGPPPGGQRPSGPGRQQDGLNGLLRHLLDQLHLSQVDTGDLLLLALLFLLSREGGDEEILVALGLLLIL